VVEALPNYLLAPSIFGDVEPNWPRSKVRRQGQLEGFQMLYTSITRTPWNTKNLIRDLNFE